MRENGAPQGQTICDAVQPPATYYPTPVYQPFYSPQGQPLTYQQYSNGYLPPNPSTAPPMTLRQYSQQLPGMLMNQAMPRVR